MVSVLIFFSKTAFMTSLNLLQRMCSELHVPFCSSKAKEPYRILTFPRKECFTFQVLNEYCRYISMSASSGQKVKLQCDHRGRTD